MLKVTNQEVHNCSQRGGWVGRMLKIFPQDAPSCPYKYWLVTLRAGSAQLLTEGWVGGQDAENISTGCSFLPLQILVSDLESIQLPPGSQLTHNIKGSHHTLASRVSMMGQGSY